MTRTRAIPFLVTAMATLSISLGCSSSITPTKTFSDSAASSASNALLSYQQDAHGITATLAGNAIKTVRLEVISDEIIRVTASPKSTISPLPNYYMVVEKPSDIPFTVIENSENLTVKTRALQASLNLKTGNVSFYNSQGQLITAEANRGTLSTVIDEPGTVDDDSYAITQSFIRDEDEGFYGLGQQQNGLVNYAGHDVELTTYNMEITVPFVLSSKNYGILWNNASVSRFGDPRPAAPLDHGFQLYDADGNKGGLTIEYLSGEQLIVKRTESDTNYQFLRQGSTREFSMPEGVDDNYNLRVKLTGSLVAKNTGTHTLKMYSSGYAKLHINGELMLDRWRMNWNPWYHNIDLELKKGEKVAIDVEWQPQKGYFRLLHNPPQSPELESLMTLSSDTAKAIDYYFVKGNDADQVIAKYRQLTGKSVLLPKWAYGFWQSRERYKSQDELLANLKAYRDRKIPIDNIVLDWSYWPEDAWGSHDFDKQYFPDPQAMVDAVHAMDANIMISVWPKFYPTTDNYRELNQQGAMLNRNIEEQNLDWIGKGYLNGFYDAFSEKGRDIFWQQLNKKLNAYDFDAWWLDAVEPDIHSNLSFTQRKYLMTPNSQGTGAEYFNAYALPHAETVYQGDRAATPNKRVFILTRSGFGGIQRTASAIWSGDIVSRWSNLKEQIAAGIGVGLSGVPNWTFDIGGFTPEDRYRTGKQGFVGATKDMDADQIDEWQELNTRWFQMGAFTPLFRSHGQNPYREIFNLSQEDSEHYQAMVWYTKLRYSLMPYIYSIAGDMYHKDATLMRGLIMDYRHDKNVADINDQYLFGPSLLINPVYSYGARSRSVYLPKGNDWYDLYTGKKMTGGRTIEASAPLSQMPIFVKAGAIIPSGPQIQHVHDKNTDPLLLTVYTGADGEFELYEDDGKSYGYENGEYSRIPFKYDDQTQRLTIGERTGNFNGMLSKRTINIRWISNARADAADFHGAFDATISYEGKSVTIARPK